MDSTEYTTIKFESFEDFPAYCDLEDIEPKVVDETDLSIEYLSEEIGLKFIDQEEKLSFDISPLKDNHESSDKNLDDDKYEKAIQLTEVCSIKDDCIEEHMIKKKTIKKRTIFDKRFRHCVQNWVNRHYCFPYPDEELKDTWATTFGVSKKQVNNLLTNLRRRNNCPYTRYSSNDLFKIKRLISQVSSE